MEIFTPVKKLLNKVYARIDAAIVKYHRTYLGFVFLFALMGYGLVLLIPFLVIVAGINLYNILPHADLSNWQAPVIWAVTLILSILFSYRMLKLRLTQPAGLALIKEEAHEIFKLVKKFSTHFKRPKIHHIVITSSYQLDIIKVPKYALPIYSSNTLVVGLPVLLCLDEKQFENIVARRIGQFSKKNNPITNWLYQLRDIWKQYGHAYGKQKHLDRFFLKWIFSAYASLYSFISTYAARLDELNADNYSMELFTHNDVCETITADIVFRWYLENTYWPAVDKIAAIKTDSSLQPYSNMKPDLINRMEERKIRSLIHKALRSEPDRNDANATLRQRLDNIGHDTPVIPMNTGASAADKYLGDSKKTVITLINKLWLKTRINQQKNKH